MYKANTMTVNKPGIASGIMIVVIMRNSDVPSNRATSLKEDGILLKAFRIMNTPIGNIAVECRNINPMCVSVKPRVFNNL